MKQFTIQDIRSWRPCYDPNRYLPEDWSGDALDILKHAEIPAADKLWVVLREGIIEDKTLRLFAVACARKALSLVPNSDPRSLIACDVTERFANELATTEELEAARQDAYDAYTAAAATAYVATAARAVAEAAAYAAYAARVADAYDAAYAAYYTAWAAAADATAAAYTAANAADAERGWQVAKLIEMLEVA